MDAVDTLRRTPPVGTERGGWEWASGDFHGRHPRRIVSTTLVVEQVRVDRRIEGGIVQFKREGSRLLLEGIEQTAPISARPTGIRWWGVPFKGVCRLTM